MASTTRSYASLASLWALLVLLAGCSGEPGDHGFQIRDVRLSPQARQLNVRFAQNLRLSPIALNALQRGVPLTVSVSMELRQQDTLILLANEQALYEIRYLPLSQHFELSNTATGEARSYPRLRHVFSALASLDLNLETGPLAPGGYEFRARTRLERSMLPAPMQLPVLVSAQWRHDSDWSTWQFRISA